MTGFRLIPNPGSKASRSLCIGLLLLSSFPTGVGARGKGPESLRALFNNGQFDRVIAQAPIEIVGARKGKDPRGACEKGVLTARSLMHLEKYAEAAKVLEEALSDAEEAKHPRSLAAVYFAKASLARYKRDFPPAIKFTRMAIAAAPDDPQVKVEFNLAIGRILYSAGFDIAAIIWLEKAERLFQKGSISSAMLDVLGHLSLAWKSKLDYSRALRYADRLEAASSGTEFKYRHRLALYELGNIANASGQARKAVSYYETGLQLARAAKDDRLSCVFLSTMLLNGLYKGDTARAESHLKILDSIDKGKRFNFDILLGKAVIAAMNGKPEISEQFFEELSSMKAHSDYAVPYWKATIAEQRKDWQRLIDQSEILRKLAVKEQFREDLPGIHLNLAKGFWGLERSDLALEHAQKTAALIEEARPADNTAISLSLLETYHSIYRLMSEILEKKGDIERSFEIVDHLKAQVLRDRIDDSALRERPDLSLELRKKAEELSLKFLDGSDPTGALDKFEKGITSDTGHTEQMALRLASLNEIEPLKSSAIVSYSFTLDGELRAYVWEQGRAVRLVRLSVSEPEALLLAKTVERKINGLIFFKNDGKHLYDRLIAPLHITSDHLIIVPDKMLWKIPFHALSPDGVSYLIEKKLISYAPSIGILITALRKPAPIRKTIKAFANDRYRGRILLYPNGEAKAAAEIFGSRAVVGAKASDFLNSSQEANIVHLAMHAELDTEEPLDSFLAFRPSGGNDGRVTVNDLLKVRLKPQSLVFLASCETTNVLDGEGVVSIAWAMLGSGSSSVVSAQWQADDKSTQVFSNGFYTGYRKGVSSAKAIQDASIAMIRNKSTGFHEPYFWAAFSLFGDFR